MKLLRDMDDKHSCTFCMKCCLLVNNYELVDCADILSLRMANLT